MTETSSPGVGSPLAPQTAWYRSLLTAVAVASVGLSGSARADESPPSPGVAQAPTPEGLRATASRPSADASVFSLQGGWWSIEAEWRSRHGVFAAAGTPWGIVPLSLMNGATWIVPLGARVGYQHNLSARWSLRGSAHAALVIDNETSKCGCASDETMMRTFAFAELGARYQSPGGFLAGLDVPLFGLRFPRKVFAPPASLAFGQIYVGYSWGL
jgi:hypothetical protein